MPDNRAGYARRHRNSGPALGRGSSHHGERTQGGGRARTRPGQTTEHPGTGERAQSGERLQKYLARAGVASRRTCEEYIVAGRVRVNGRVVVELGTRIDAEGDLVEFDGRPVVPMDREPVVYLLYKPRGYLSTVSDPHGRRTVLSLVLSDERLYPVGRLDFDSEGLLLLTNDGDLAHRLMHPRFQHEKEYLVLVQGSLSSGEIEQLARGVHVEDEGKTLFVRAQVESAVLRGRWREESSPPGTSWLRIRLQEGKKRQIRRMLEVIGHRVERLIRVRVGSLDLGNLKPGQGRWLTKGEMRGLRQEVGLEKRPTQKSNTQKDAKVEEDQHRHRRTGSIRQEHRRRPSRE
jgi:pseudouridine synthase